MKRSSIRPRVHKGNLAEFPPPLITSVLPARDTKQTNNEQGRNSLLKLGCVCTVSPSVYNEMPKLSTVQVAKLLGVPQPNFQRAIKQGTIPAPPLADVGGIKVRLWSPKDVRRAIEALKKSKGWKKPRRKPEGAESAQGVRNGRPSHQAQK